MSRPPPDPLHILHSESGSVTALHSFGAKFPELLVSGSETGHITIWSLKTYRPVNTWKAHNSTVQWIASTEHPGCLISQGRKDSVIVWSEEHEALLKIAINHDCFCKCDILGFLLAMPLEKNDVQVVNIEDTKKKMVKKITPSKDEGAIFVIKLLNSERLLTAYESGTLIIWNLPDSTVECQAHVAHLPNCAAHHQERNEILVGTSSETLFVYDDRDLKLLKEVPLVNPGLNSIIVRPTDGRIYATAGWDKRIRVFSSKTHKKLCVLQVHEGSVNALCYVIANRALLAAGGSDGLISLWDLYNDLASHP